MRNIIGVEVLAKGKWTDSSGIPVDLYDADLLEVTKNTDYLLSTKRLTPRLKLGHSGKQALDQSDGQPSLGHISNPRVKEGKLLVDFEDVPDVLFSAIQNKLYTNVSSELDFSEDIGLFLGAVALLGVDLPAINSLNDLQTYLSKSGGDHNGDKITGDNLRFSSCHILKHSKQGEKMTDLEKVLAEIKKMQPGVDVEKIKADLAVQFSKKGDDGKLTKENIDLRAQVRTLQFAQVQKDFLAPYEKLVAEKKATPALVEKIKVHVETQKVAFSKSEVETLTPPVNIVEILEETRIEGKKKMGSTSFSKGDESGDTDESVDVKVAREVKKLLPETGGNYGKATNLLFSRDPQIAVDYRDYQIAQHTNPMYTH